MRLTLAERRAVAEGTEAFRFTTEEPFTFVAGQSGDFRIPDIADATLGMHAFSIASPPEDEGLLVATRMRDSPFKRWLAEAAPGAQIELDGPFGEFVLPESTERPLVFLAGGIGITPVRSILLHAERARTGHRSTLIYANRNLAAAAFHDELCALAERDAAFTYVPVLGEAGSDWQGETGRIDADLVRRHVADLQAPIYYFVGPPAMVDAMKALLLGLGIPETRLVHEDFAGY